MTFIPSTSPSRTAKWAKGSGGPAGDECQNLVAHSLTANGFDASEDGTGRGTPIVPVFGQCHGSNVGPVGTLRKGNGNTSGGVPFVAFSGKDHGSDAGELAPTLRAMGHKGSHANAGGQVAVAFAADDYAAGTFEECTQSRPLTRSPDRSMAAPLTIGTAVRRLTPRECERLMGWPDDWTRWDDEGKELKDGPRYRLCGNGVVANVAEWIGRRLMQAQQ